MLRLAGSAVRMSCARYVCGSVGARAVDAAAKGKYFEAVVLDRPDESRDVRLRRLKYQMQHRGLVENELILSSFFREHGQELTDAQLDAFEDILVEPDQHLFKWVTRKTEAPDHLDPDLVAAIRHHVENDPLRYKRKHPDTYVA